MKGVYPILKRELRSYFASPLAYVILVVFQLVSAMFFFLNLKGFLHLQFDPSYQLLREELNLNTVIIIPYFDTMSIVLLFIIPLITMRLLADERKSHTAELLFTSPIKLRSIILGKYLAALILLIIMLCLSSLNIVVLMAHGNPDLGVVLSSYLGLLLLGASFLAIGIFASSLSSSQLVAAVIAFGILLLLWLVGASSDTESSIFGYISLISHFKNFGKGIIELKDLAYYLSVIYIGLFLTHTALDSERWR
ncbi:MAG: ABC transporter permease subunit [Thermodesulfobacteriales bacterium]|jgi:ABC-2 type transport system permease protein|nr:MAG: ABC transporter [Thermodesulfobacteriales bacterium]